MRWFWRADPLTIVLDGLLEGSLVGVAYAAIAVLFLALPGGTYVAPLSLPVFWLAAAAGLAAARLPRGTIRTVLSVPVVALGLAALGWASDPDVPGVLLHRDLGHALALHPAGWMLGVAVLRGAVHSNTARESDISTDAMAVSFPLLGTCLLIGFVSGRGSGGLALIAASVCVVAGMLALALSRIRELESSMSVVRPAARAWREIASGIVVLALGCVLTALVVGATAQEPLFAAGRSLAAAGEWLAVQAWSWLSALLRDLAALIPSPPPLPTAVPRPVGVPQPGGVRPPANVGDVEGVRRTIDLVLRVALLAGAVIGFLLLQAYARRWRFRNRPRQGRHPIRQERLPSGGGFSLRRLVAAGRPRLPFRRHRPATAAEAYLAILDELSAHDALCRQSDETPRQHARRLVGASADLDGRPLVLLAADYQLAVYGKVPISGRETARALGRWQRLRKLLARLPNREET